LIVSCSAGGKSTWYENVKLWNALRGWAGANAAALRLCFHMTVAGLLAYVLAELLALPRAYWAVFSAIIIVQASVGGSVRATIDRVIGTIGGAVAGGAVGYLLPHDSALSRGVALVIALVPLTLVAALRPNYRIAPVTAVIVLLTFDAQLGPLGSAFYRILEIALGCFVGLVVSLVLLPARAHGLVISTAASMLTQLADLLGDWLAVLAGSAGRTRITQLQDNIRVGMARLEIVAGEARQERRAHLTQFDPDPLVLTIFRLRNDVVMIGRAAAEPLPGPIVGHLRQPLEQVSQAAQRFLRTSAGALRERKIPPALDVVEQALAKFIATIEELRREGATQGLSADDIGRLYALEFALEQQRQNFVDFRDRVTECAGAHSEA
jgi:uncharacterized membrane protein YccC